jgi:hypothetical protein
LGSPDRRLRVFVSSTLGELAEERRAVARAISALRLTTEMFASAPGEAVLEGAAEGLRRRSAFAPGRTYGRWKPT